MAVATGFEIFIPLEGLIDVEKEKNRINKEILLAAQDKERCESKLSKESFVARAPKEEVEKIRIRLQEAGIKISKLKESLEFIG